MCTGGAVLVRAEDAVDQVRHVVPVLVPIGSSVSEVHWEDFTSSPVFLLQSVVKLKVLGMRCPLALLLFLLLLLIDGACEVLSAGLWGR